MIVFLITMDGKEAGWITPDSTTLLNFILISLILLVIILSFVFLGFLAKRSAISEPHQVEKMPVETECDQVAFNFKQLATEIHAR